MTTESNKNATQPAYAKLAPGTLIVSATRMPSVDQPWIHPIYIGVIEAPGTDPSVWNGYNSEAHYCEVTGTARVSYDFGKIMHDKVSDLMPITAEQAILTGRERVQFFLGAVVVFQLERHSHKTRDESEAYWKHLEDFVPPDTCVSRTEHPRLIDQLGKVEQKQFVQLPIRCSEQRNPDRHRRSSRNSRRSCTQ